MIVNPEVAHVAINALLIVNLFLLLFALLIQKKHSEVLAPSLFLVGIWAGWVEVNTEFGLSAFLICLIVVTIWFVVVIIKTKKK